MADRYNPFGIGKPNHNARNLICYSTENCEEPEKQAEVGPPGSAVGAEYL